MRRAAALVMTLALGAVSPGAQAPASRRLLTGAWGGDRIRLIGSPDDLRLQIDCLAGHLDAPVTLTTGGTFTAALRLAPVRGAPIEGDAEVPLAQLAGTVRGDTLRLTVGPEGREGAGTYTLTRGGKATLPNCRLRS